MYGWQVHEARGKNIIDLIAPAASRNQAMQILNVLRQGKVWSGEMEAQRKDGTVFPTFITDSPVYHQNGKLSCIIGVSSDITERKQMETELKESEGRYKKAQELGRTGHWELDLKTFKVIWSEEIYKLFGLSPNEIEPTYAQFLKFVHPDDKKWLHRRVEASIFKKEDYNIVHRIVLKNGTTRYIHEIGKPKFDETGQPVKFAGTLQDVTEQKEKEIALKQSESRLKSILDSQTTFVIRTDLEGNFTYYNNKFFETFGWLYGKEDLYGLSSLPSIVSYELERVTETVYKCIAQPNVPFAIDMDKPGKNQTVRSTLWDFVCLLDMNNQPAEIQCVGIDITDWKKAERELMKTLEEKNIVLESIDDVFFALDKQRNLSYFNKEAAAVFGVTRTEVIGKNFYEYLTAVGDTGFTKRIEQAYDADSPQRFEFFSAKQSRWWDIATYHSGDGIAVSMRDVTHKKVAETKLVESEEKYRALFENSPSPKWIFDEETLHFLEVNKAAVEQYGYSKNAFLAMKLPDVKPNKEITEFNNALKRAKFANTIYYNSVHLKKNGDLIKVHVTANAIVYNNRRARLAEMVDHTEQEKAKDELIAKAQELRRLTSHLQHIREEERASMAREIHDELGQQLTGIKMDISWLNRNLPAPDEKTNKKLKSSLQAIDTTINMVRKIASQLRPSILDDLGLAEALDWQSRDFENRTGIAVSFHSNAQQVKFAPAISIAVFRIYQESLTNVARHANATKVECRLQVQHSVLTLTTTDNGTGFETQQQAKGKTLGLLGMQERVAILNGTYTITSQPGKGTTVTIQIPLVQENK